MWLRRWCPELSAYVFPNRKGFCLSASDCPQPAPEVFVGVDVAKGKHYACAVSARGEPLFARPVPNDEGPIRRLIEDAAAHGSPALVVDTTSSAAEPHRVFRRLYWLGDNGVMGRLMMYSPEVRERAVRMVLEHRGEHRSEWAAICSIAEKFGCSSETLRKWVRRAETDQGLRPGLTSPERERLRALEREVRELRRANEILRKASAYFAQAELDRRPRR